MKGEMQEIKFLNQPPCFFPALVLPDWSQLSGNILTCGRLVIGSVVFLSLKLGFLSLGQDIYYYFFDISLLFILQMYKTKFLEKHSKL
jgi:hypothetical protein